MTPGSPGDGTGHTFTDPRLREIADAVSAVGIPVRRGAVPDDLLLPGVLIDRGTLLVDEARLLFPGDVLHEAGHVAVLPPSERERTVGLLPADGGQEMAALAWSYAAAVAFSLPLDVVFHDKFKAGGRWLRESFTAGVPFGVPLLQWWEMTRLPDAPPAFDHLTPFPAMTRWLRDHEPAAAPPG
ncbi:hypothetical protein [Thalassobaculum fulvum]|uniref:hypothetical protein n=1 Tax=Thalassobaculum fulvum TaxID=1633335 RepID=UPI00167C3F7E|nr:hypothetical protein [Thalassobaculum fulvum]